MSVGSFKILFRCVCVIISVTAGGFVNRSQAAEITINVAEEGKISQNGDLYIDDGHFAGNAAQLTAVRSDFAFRNFFSFNIPKLSSQQIVGADLVINTAGVFTGQSSSVTYQLTSLSPGLNYNNLGTGNVYGDLTATKQDSNKNEVISLDSAAISALNDDKGSLFWTGGRIISPTVFSSTAADQGLFFDSQNSTVELQLDVTPVSPVPLPGTLILFGSCLIGIAGYVHRRPQSPPLTIR